MSEQRERFRQLIEDLVSQFEREVDTGEWVTKRYPKRMRDLDRQIYEVPALYLQKGPTRLLLDPIGYDVPGAEGAADLYIMPTYDDMVSLIFEDGRWVFYESPTPGPNGIPSEIEAKISPLSVETINRVLDSIAAHAVPSV